MSEPVPQPVCRRGWRTFECDSPERCGYRWQEATRDHLSPSISDCPVCRYEASPVAGHPDPSLPVDAMGNLTIPWSERIRRAPTPSINP